MNDRTERKVVDEVAEALMFIQWVAYGAATSNGTLTAEWPAVVWKLYEYFRGDNGLNAALGQILWYSPAQWRDGNGDDLEEKVRWMWLVALRDRALFGSDSTFALLLSYYHRLNYHAEKQNLLCSSCVKDASEEHHALVYEAQGRLRSSKYKVVSKIQWVEDGKLRATTTSYRSWS
jgi:hypothetical protein